MADTPPPLSSEPNTPPSSAAEQARIRKERREAKIRAGGSARLSKITGLGGGVQRDPPSQPTASEAKSNDAADPDEVDISQHFYQPTTTARPRIPLQRQQQQLPADMQLSEDQLRAMMLGFPSSGTGTPQQPQLGLPPNLNPNPFAGFPGMGDMSAGPDVSDPMLKLLQQMMGGMGGGAGAGGGIPGIPMPGQDTPTAATSDPHAYLWRIIHAIFALALGLYIALTVPNFTGTKLERDKSALLMNTDDDEGDAAARHHRRLFFFFYVFATAEVVLQTSRFYIERRAGGTVGHGGGAVLGMVMGLLPQPWKGYLVLFLRYARIWTTTSGDALVCVFVLGVCSWLRGAGE